MIKPDYTKAFQYLVGKPSVTAEWTDEQWAARDADIAEDERALAMAKTRVTAGQLVELGWPRLALEVAAANPTAICVFHDDLPRRNVVVLAGGVGVGKTVAVAAWALQTTARPRFLRASSFAASSRYDSDKRETWLGSRSLVLDDLGQEYLDRSGSFLVDFNELVDTFTSEQRTLVITTNMTREDFAVRYGERIADRMRETARWITMPGPSRRGR